MLFIGVVVSPSLATSSYWCEWTAPKHVLNARAGSVSLGFADMFIIVNNDEHAYCAPIHQTDAPPRTAPSYRHLVVHVDAVHHFCIRVRRVHWRASVSEGNS